MSSKKNLYRMILAAMLLALALVLPFLTGQIPQIGKALCPMHIPVLLCGFFCGPWYGLAVGFIAPLFRFMLFGMPPIIPTGVGMCFELATYGFVSGMLYRVLPKKKQYIYVALIGAMIAGRIVWGIARVIIYGLTDSQFGWIAFISGAFLDSVPGIIVQIILIPIIVMTLEKYADK
ncbi:MAG: ECF transporter S component [Lachnospiraceae bacterium]|nr:ECF transporter S component [Lachnospiraceae bacterium]